MPACTIGDCHKDQLPRCFEHYNQIEKGYTRTSCKSAWGFIFNVRIAISALTIVNLVFMSGINCMETMPDYDRAKGMLKHLKI